MGVNICVRFFTLQKDIEILQLGMVMKHITAHIERFGKFSA